MQKTFVLNYNMFSTLNLLYGPVYYNLHVVSKEKHFLKYFIDMRIWCMSSSRMNTRKTKHRLVAETYVVNETEKIYQSYTHNLYIRLHFSTTILYLQNPH